MIFIGNDGSCQASLGSIANFISSVCRFRVCLSVICDSLIDFYFCFKLAFNLSSRSDVLCYI
jgi:hypothetical protein